MNPAILKDLEVRGDKAIRESLDLIGGVAGLRKRRLAARWDSIDVLPPNFQIEIAAAIIHEACTEIRLQTYRGAVTPVETFDLTGQWLDRQEEYASKVREMADGCVAVIVTPVVLTVFAVVGLIDQSAPPQSEVCGRVGGAAVICNQYGKHDDPIIFAKPGWLHYMTESPIYSVSGGGGLIAFETDVTTSVDLDRVSRLYTMVDASD